MIIDEPDAVTACSVYVYYKTESDQYAEIRGMLIGLPSAMTKAGYRCRVQQRRDLSSDGRHTWMEIYEDVPLDTVDEFPSVRKKIVSSIGLAPYLSSAHVEVFSELKICKPCV